jgi:hypothetical protein
MKTINYLLTITAVAIVAIATAVEKPKMNIVPLNADRAIVSITNENPAYFELSIQTQKGDVVYYKQSNKPLTDYQKVYDFKELENGNYVLNLKVNDTKLSKEIQVASNRIYVGDSKIQFDPYFAFDGQVLKFSYLNFDKEMFKMNIYDENGMIYESKLGKDIAITNGYDLSKLEAGNYKVVLRSFTNEYVYSLVK